MKKYCYLLTILLSINLIAGYSNAQNVANGSFETRKQCPTGLDQVDQCLTPQVNLPGWYNTTHLSSPDYFSGCLPRSANLATVPDNQVGTQNARSGISYAGILIDMDLGGNTRDGYREYLTNKLNSPLQEGKTYRIIFWASLAGYVNNSDHWQAPTHAIKQLGAYFSNQIPAQGNIRNSRVLIDPSTNQPYTPQVVNTQNFLSDTTNWMKIEGYYTVPTGGGDINYVTIGNFQEYIPSNEIIQVYNGTLISPHIASSYYYIDDVSITPICDCDVIPANSPDFNIKLVERTTHLPGQGTDEKCYDIVLTNKLDCNFNVPNIQLSYSGSGAKLYDIYGASRSISSGTTSLISIPGGIIQSQFETGKTEISIGSLCFNNYSGLNNFTFALDIVNGTQCNKSWNQQIDLPIAPDCCNLLDVDYIYRGRDNEQGLCKWDLIITKKPSLFCSVYAIHIIKKLSGTRQIITNNGNPIALADNPFLADPLSSIYLIPGDEDIKIEFYDVNGSVICAKSERLRCISWRHRCSGLPPDPGVALTWDFVTRRKTNPSDPCCMDLYLSYNPDDPTLTPIYEFNLNYLHSDENAIEYVITNNGLPLTNLPRNIDYNSPPLYTYCFRPGETQVTAVPQAFTEGGTCTGTNYIFSSGFCTTIDCCDRLFTYLGNCPNWMMCSGCCWTLNIEQYPDIDPLCKIYRIQIDENGIDEYRNGIFNFNGSNLDGTIAFPIAQPVCKLATDLNKSGKYVINFYGKDENSNEKLICKKEVNFACNATNNGAVGKMSDQQKPSASMSLQITPNPVTDEATFIYNLPEVADNPVIEVINILGETVDKILVNPQYTTTNTYIYNCNKLQAGIYIVRLHSNKGIISIPMNIHR